MTDRPRETEAQLWRRERAEARAESKRRAAEAATDEALRAVEHIPPGQPILVGHHSEGRHRRDLARADARMRKSVELDREARRAEASVSGAGRAILSDDPEALDALRAERAAAAEYLELARRLNRVYARAAKGGAGRLAALDAAIAEVPELGVEDAVRIRRTFEVAHFLRRPLDTGNLSARVRRIDARIAELEARAAREPRSVEGPGVSAQEDLEDGRVRIRFDARPTGEVREALSRSGWRWSPRAGAWQRQATERAWHDALRVVEVARRVAEENAS